MGNRHVHEIECLQRLGTSESGRPKVTALPSPERLRAGRSKPFLPDCLSPPLQKAGFLALRHSLERRGFPERYFSLIGCPFLPAGRQGPHPEG